MFLDMIKTVRKVGGSLAVTLPTRELRQLGINEHNLLHVVIEDGVIKLYPLFRAPQTRKIERQTEKIIAKYATAIDALAER